MIEDAWLAQTSQAPPGRVAVRSPAHWWARNLATVTGYVDGLLARSGRRTPARAWLDSDAPQLSLNGDWRFRCCPATPVDRLRKRRGCGHRARLRRRRLGHHRGAGALGAGRRRASTGQPIYTNVQYPFPIDPPHVPGREPDRRLPAHLRPPGLGRAERMLLRFDGVESVYRVWLNGTEVGVGKGSRLVQEFDVTELLRPGRNVIMVRVHQWSSMSYLEDQDQWWLPGIFRDVTLLGRPAGGARRRLAARRVRRRRRRARSIPRSSPADDAYPVTIEIPELGVAPGVRDAGRRRRRSTVGAVEPWSAETPRLYDGDGPSGRGETVTLRLGLPHGADRRRPCSWSTAAR